MHSFLMVIVERNQPDVSEMIGELMAPYRDFDEETKPRKYMVHDLKNIGHDSEEIKKIYLDYEKQYPKDIIEKTDDCIYRITHRHGVGEFDGKQYGGRFSESLGLEDTLPATLERLGEYLQLIESGEKPSEEFELTGSWKDFIFLVKDIPFGVFPHDILTPDGIWHSDNYYGVPYYPSLTNSNDEYDIKQELWKEYVLRIYKKYYDHVAACIDIHS